MNTFVSQEPSRYDEAVSLFSRGKLEEALDDFRNLRESGDDRDLIVSCLLWEVDCLLCLDRMEEARETVARVQQYWAEARSWRLNIDLSRAGLLFSEGRSRAALFMLFLLKWRYRLELRKEEKKSLWEWLEGLRGDILVSLGKYRKAEKVVRSCTPCMDPHRMMIALRNLGICRFEFGDLQEAKVRFEAVLGYEIDQGLRAEAYYYLGMIAYSSSDYSTARDYFESCLSIDAWDDQARQNAIGWLACARRQL